MTLLILLNGPPASGKSTLALRLVEHNPTTLNLDIDLIRSQQRDWPADPIGAGLSARRVAIAAARDHLLGGHDVVIPQFLGRIDFIEELDTLADALDVSFVEIMLEISRDVARTAFTKRSANPQNQTHHDAAMLVARSDADDPLGEMYDAAIHIMDIRPATKKVAVRHGDIDATFEALQIALASADA